MALLAYFLMHDVSVLMTDPLLANVGLDPETARFLTDDERQFVVRALREDSKGHPTSV